jgi:hypothetical protein
LLVLSWLENSFFLAGKSDFHTLTKILTGLLKFPYGTFPHELGPVQEFAGFSAGKAVGKRR